MKKNTIIAIFMFFSINIVLFSQEKKQDENKNDYSPSYMLGVAFTRNINDYEFTKDETIQIINGFKDGINKKVNYKDVVNYEKLNEFMKAKKEKIIERNKIKGSEYLEKMSKESGAKRYNSGLVMIIEKQGEGNMPKVDDTVKVHYKGRLIDGKVFDSSYERDKPVEFSLSNVIPCFREAIMNMNIGGKAKIGCPSDIAYGDSGIDPVIPGGSTLVFDIELLDIVKKQEANTEAKK